MQVNFKFLGTEPIENVITFMNFHMDRAVFFGYSEVIEARKAKTEKFLKKYCGVQQVKFLPISHKNLDSVIKVIQREIDRETACKNEIFFDITGGESLFLVALGSLSEKLKIPMHMYDIEKNALILLNRGIGSSILDNGRPKKTVLDIDRFVELHGGIINYKLHKDIKEDNAQILGNIDRLWEVARKHISLWNPFSDLCRACFVPEDGLYVNASIAHITAEMQRKNTALKDHDRLSEILRDLNDAGAICGLRYGPGECSFRYSSAEMKDCLWEGGSILELYVYKKYCAVSGYCKAGVHIDWDGVIHSAPGKDVLNEVDVLALNGNVPTFISCKSGKMGPAQTLHALYELQTVADRFGGKYARKVLVSAMPLAGDIYKERAAEMNIEVLIAGQDASI